MNWDKKAPSKGAQSVKDFLKANCINYVWFEEYRLPGTKLRVDFLSPTKKIAIEFNGQQHSKFIEFFHKTRSQFGSSVRRDFDKEEILVKNDYVLVEVTDADLPLTRDFFEIKYNVFI